MICQLRDLGRDYYTKKPIITLVLEDKTNLVEWANQLTGKDLDLELRAHSDDRSLEANGFYWALIGKLAAYLKRGYAETHNMIMQDYGTDMVVRGYPITVDLPEDEETELSVMKDKTNHLRPTDRVFYGTDGVLYRTYIARKPSHTCNKTEFSRLIDGLITECNDRGIPTISDEEYERMMANYGKEHHNK